MYFSTGVLSGDQGREISEQAVLTECCVLTADIVTDLRCKFRNLAGGELRSYSRMLDRAAATALRRLAEKAGQDGWRGVHSIRIRCPRVSEGAAEVTAVGTAFR